MNYVQLSVFGAIAGTLSMILLYVYLYVLYRERYMGMWIISWVVFFSRIALFDSGFFDWKNTFAAFIAYEMCYVIGPILTVYAIHLFINKPLKKYWIYGAILAAILSMTANIMHLPAGYKLAPLAWFACVMLLYVGKAFINIRTPGIGKYIIGGAFFLWFLFTFIAPFFVYSSEFQWRLSLIGGILRLIITSGTLLVYFEKTRTDLIDNQESLRQSNRELNSFCHSIAHDLKAPLLSLNKLTEFLALDYREKLDRDGQELIQNIQEKAMEVIQITDHLLELSKMGEMNMHFELIKLESLFRDVFKELMNLQPERQVEFSIRELPDIYGDPVMIKLLVQNILSNALKYTRHREQAIIKVDSIEVEDNYMISVKDNGAGFDMRYASRLFGVFQRLHSNSEFEGSGVGLAISQKILKRHHGKAWMTGKVDEGAVFYFSFPKNMEQHFSEPAPILSEAGGFSLK